MAAGISIQRQAAPMQHQVDGRATAGISAFAFQGTNAHIILAPNPDDAQEIRAERLNGHSQAAVWQRGRFWYLPAPHSLLVHFGWQVASQQAVWDVQLGQSKHSFLWDHQVHALFQTKP